MLALITTHNPKTGPKDRRPLMPLETMLRIYFLHDWFAQNDRTAKETLDHDEAIRCFARIELGDVHIPDYTTIFKFRHLLGATRSPRLSLPG